MRWFIVYISGGERDGSYALVQAVDEDDVETELQSRIDFEYEEVDIFEPTFIFRDLGDI